MIAYELKHNSRSTTSALIAKISAGQPLSIEPLVERVDLNQLLTHGSDSCLLIQIEGDSMEDVPIFDGDWVMLDRLKKPEFGDIVVACLNGEYTIKRHKTTDKFGNRGLYLVAANSQVNTIKIDEEKDEYEIFGVVTFIIHPTK